MDATFLLAAWGAVLSTLLALVTIATFRRDSPRLRLSLSQAIPVGAIEAYFAPEISILVLTVTNVGRQPIGVSSIGLSLSGGKYIPGINAYPDPGASQLSGPLQPGQHASTWWGRDATIRTLRENGFKIEAAVANLSDGRHQRQRLPRGWRSLADR